MLHSWVYEASKLLLQLLLLIKLSWQLLVLLIRSVVRKCHVRARHARRRWHVALSGGCLLLPQLQPSPMLQRILGCVVSALYVQKLTPIHEGSSLPTYQLHFGPMTSRFGLLFTVQVRDSLCSRLPRAQFS
jgi:hypothetical protein